MPQQSPHEKSEGRCHQANDLPKASRGSQSDTLKAEIGTPPGTLDDTKGAVESTAVTLPMVFENISDGIIVADAETKRFVSVNPAICRMLGYDEAEMLELSVADIHPPTDLPKVIDAFKALSSGDTKQVVDIPMLCKDGRVFYADVHSSSVELAGETFLLGTFHDVTQRKRVELALWESEERYRALVMQSADCLLLHDMESNILDVNPSSCKTYGYSREELLSMKVVDLDPDYVEREDGGDFWEKFEMNQPFRFEARQCKKDGTIFPVEVTITKILIGGKTLIMGLCRDITERKRAEEKIKASLKEKELLLSEIHHRVKNNMQVISSLLNLQANRVKDKEYADLLNVSRDRIRSMALIHEKLYLSKNFARIDFNEYIKSLSRDLFRSYGADPNKISLKTEVEDVSLGLDNAIPCALIMNELVSNSLKYAFPEDRKGEIEIALRSVTGDEVELIVGDNGTGLPEDLDFRNTESLGLHIVTILAEDQLEGTIELDRTGGTEFFVRFKSTPDKVRI